MITDVAVAQPRTLQNIILDKVPGVDLDQNLVNAGVGVLDIRSVYDIDGVDTRQSEHRHPGRSGQDRRQLRVRRASCAWRRRCRFRDRTVVDLAGAAFGASNYMLEILGYAPIEPDGSVRVEVPADVAFRMEVLDANGAPHRLHPGRVAAGEPGRSARPATAATAPPARRSRSRTDGRDLFNSAWAGAAASGDPFPHTIASGSRRLPAEPGRDHGAGAHARELHERLTAVPADGAGRQRDLHATCGPIRRRRPRARRSICATTTPRSSRRRSRPAPPASPPGRPTAASSSTTRSTCSRCGICRGRRPMPRAWC